MSTPSVRIFGREPAFWVGVIEAILAVALSWHITGLSTDTVGGIMAVVVALSGVYVAYVTRDTMLAVLVGLAKAIVICLATFQVHLTDAQTTSVIALVTILGGAFNRSQTAPALYPSFKDPTPPETYADAVEGQAGIARSGDRTTYRKDERGQGVLSTLLIVAGVILIAVVVYAVANGR